MSARQSSQQDRHEISVMVEDKAWKGVSKPLVGHIRRAAAFTLLRAGAAPAASLTVLLTDDAHIQALNQRHRRKDKPTNVLSFPSSVPDYLGDVAIAYGVTAREASATNKLLTEHAVHLAVHGTLHLLGYDHVRSKDAEKMEALEREILAELGIPDPYRRNAA